MTKSSEMLTMNICLSYAITSFNIEILEAACCCTLIIRTWHGVTWTGARGKSSEIDPDCVSPVDLWLQGWKMMESSSMVIEAPREEWTPRLWTGASVSYAGSTTVLSWRKTGMDKMEDHFEYILYVDCSFCQQKLWQKYLLTTMNNMKPMWDEWTIDFFQLLC